ncbi:glycoside hydrolase family 43 protein [Marinilabilia rubra]|uniref:Beta-glucanase n=1 Tax=Marinilabilia rubra TaxID=2162893 RepID=A0A2U2B743_9BACT|nr:glycoside hydrolase family 43 protein [Marinilabilia rubra]PWD98875.1 beta-glucanase [Marinilabilia rubra]
MYFKTKVKLFLLLNFFAIALNSWGQANSFKPGKIWYDNSQVHINAHGGGILFFDDTYFWFGEHKIEGEAGNVAHVGVHVYSSKDLYNWKDEGIALAVSDDPESPIIKGCIIERPKVIYNEKNDEFVMWFHHELKGKGYSAGLTGLAVSKSVTGPYQYIHSVRPNAGQWPVNVKPIHQQGVPETTKDSYCGGPECLPGNIDTINILGRDFEKGQMSRDMTLFVDDDGAAYHIHSSEENSTTHISKLSDDYKSFSGEYVRIFPARYMEAPAIFKHDGKYFFMASGCTGWSPNSARSAVAENIFGPWKELGNPCVSEGKETTYNSQSTYILPVQGVEDSYIFMADRWNPKDAIDGRYIWLPIQFNDAGNPYIEWIEEWSLEIFDNK